MDPFRLLAQEDPDDEVVSVIAQEGVVATYSGAASVGNNGQTLVEGVAGTGDDFMLGRVPPTRLPHDVAAAVGTLLERARKRLGDVRLEWVFDGADVWVVQLHRGRIESKGRIIFPGTPKVEHDFSIANGLEALRALVDRLTGTGEGVILRGDVGITSHFGDVLRRAKVPSRIEPWTEQDLPGAGLG